MPLHSNQRYERWLEEEERRFNHLRKKPAGKIRRLHVERHASAVPGTPNISVRPIAEVANQPCSERGCLLPGRFAIRDLWGHQVYCAHHARFLSLGKSSEDREHALIYRDNEYGCSRLDGLSTGDLPQPTFFGLRVPSNRIVTFGKGIVAGKSVSAACRDSGLSSEAAKKFLQRTGIAVPFERQRQERRRARERERQARAIERERQRQERIARLREPKFDKRQALSFQDAIRLEKLLLIDGLHTEQAAQIMDCSPGLPRRMLEIFAPEEMERRRREYWERRERQSRWNPIIGKVRGAEVTRLTVPSQEQPANYAKRLRAILSSSKRSYDYRWSVVVSAGRTLTVTNLGER